MIRGFIPAIVLALLILLPSAIWADSTCEIGVNVWESWSGYYTGSYSHGVTAPSGTASDSKDTGPCYSSGTAEFGSLWASAHATYYSVYDNHGHVVGSVSGSAGASAFWNDTVTINSTDPQLMGTQGRVDALVHSSTSDTAYVTAMNAIWVSSSGDFNTVCSFDFTFGTPFAFFASANASSGSASLTWLGFTSVKDSTGNTVSDYSVNSLSGTNWAVPEPPSMLGLLGLLGGVSMAGLRRLRSR